jgi:putative transport protein
LGALLSLQTVAATRCATDGVRQSDGIAVVDVRPPYADYRLPCGETIQARQFSDNRTETSSGFSFVGSIAVNGVARAILALAFVIASGIALGKVKIGGVSLGMTMVLFVGIAVSHFGIRVEHSVLHFIREFGLILFVYAVGLQVGPGFFSSFRKGGIGLNLAAVGVVTAGVLVTLLIHCVSGIPMPTMAGILSGAVTNTPGLGAAQEAFVAVNGEADSSIALGYAVAYPLGVTGIILSIAAIRRLFRISLEAESESLRESSTGNDTARSISVEIRNPALFGKSIRELTGLVDRRFVVSRIMHVDGGIVTASSDDALNDGDRLLIVTSPGDAEAIAAFAGKRIDMSRENWNGSSGADLAVRRILVSRSEVNGKTLSQTDLRHKLGVNVTRVARSGVDLVAAPCLRLQLGDEVTVVGNKHAVAEAEKLLGNQRRHLNEPNLAPIFGGICLGVAFGSIPFAFPGIPHPVKLGLAGGPLMAAILMSVFGTKFGLATYTSTSANMMLREIGICLFLACVGLGAGENFVDTVISGSGLKWMALGAIITVVPLLTAGAIARRFMRMNYFTLMGLLAGSTTDPPALAYSVSVAGNDAPSISYAAVYPLTMFLRVLSAQLLILMFA